MGFFKPKGDNMRLLGVVLFILLASMLVLTMFAGCSKECEECQRCPDCPDTNATNIDPPYIQNILGPGELTVGDNGDFSYEVLTDTSIVRSSWIFFANSDEYSDYFFPGAGASEGNWTPDSEPPNMFANADTGETLSYTYSRRGVFTATLEIEDADGYVERSGTFVQVEPAVPDTDENHIIIAPGLTDTVYGDEFAMLDCALWASDGCLASAYADSFDVFKNFAFIDSLSGIDDRYVSSSVKSGKIIQVAGAASNPGTLFVNFDVIGAMHLWDAEPTDFVKYSVFVTTRLTDGGLPETQYVYSKTLDGSEGDQSYYLDSNYEISIPVNFEGSEEYKLWVGTKIEILSSEGAGAAICFDGENGMTRLNYVILALDKP